MNRFRRRPRVQARSVTVSTISLLLALVLSRAPVVTAERAAHAGQLENGIELLQREGNFAKALEVAKQRLDSLIAANEAKDYLVADARRRVATLTHITTLPAREREELAEAYRLNETIRKHYEKAEYDVATELARTHADTYRRHLGERHPDFASALNLRGEIRMRQGKFVEAEGIFRQALSIDIEVLGEAHPKVAVLLTNLALTLQRQGNYTQAERQFRSALKSLRLSLGDDHLDVAHSLNRLAILLAQITEYAEAESLFLEALDIRRARLGDDDPLVAESLNSLANLARFSGDYPAADSLYRRALAIQRNRLGDNSPRTMGTLNNLAVLYRELGNYAMAEPLYRRALAVSSTALGNDSPQAAMFRSNLAGLLHAQGDYAAAERLYRESLAALRARHGSEHLGVARVLNNLANLLRERGDYAEADSLFQEALAIRRRILGEASPVVAETLNDLANLRSDAGRYAEAEQLRREARELVCNAPGAENHLCAFVLRYLARDLERQGNATGAEQTLREAIAIGRSAYGDSHPLVAASLSDLGWLVYAQGDAAEAERLLEQATASYDVARLKAGSGITRATFLESPYSRLAVVRLAAGADIAAWSPVERSLGQALGDLLFAADERQLTPGELAKQDSLRKVMDGAERKLAGLRRRAIKDTTATLEARMQSARTLLLAAQAEWSSFQLSVAERYPVSEGRAFPLERVQLGLGETDAVLGWLDASLGADRFASWAYVIRKHGPVRWAPVARATKESSLLEERFRSAIENPRQNAPDVNKHAQALAKKRITPVSDALEGVTDLVVIPSGPMLGIPVETLTDERGNPMGDRFTVSYIPSATIYTWLLEKSRNAARKRTGKILLVGDPPFREAHRSATSDEFATVRGVMVGTESTIGSLPRLPLSRAEVVAVAELAPEPTVLMGVDASEQNLRRLAETRALEEFDVIHLATHGLVNSDSPDRSTLVFSQVDLPDAFEAAVAGDPVYDGLVTAREIVRGWKLTADIVTLSACETGLGKRIRGEGYVGFMHAFLQAGARSLLVSLWKVDDQATSLLMQRFYKNYFAKTDHHLTKAQALQEAKLWLRNYTDDFGDRPYEHPGYWSAFILVGDRG